MMVAESSRFMTIVDSLVSSQSIPAVQDRLRLAFNTLMTSNDGVSFSLDRMNRRKFCTNLKEFILDVRGFVRTK